MATARKLRQSSFEVQESESKSTTSTKVSSTATKKIFTTVKSTTTLQSSSTTTATTASGGLVATSPISPNDCDKTLTLNDNNNEKQLLNNSSIEKSATKKKSDSTTSTTTKKKSKKSKKSESEKENISVKSSFSKFDALQKKNILHVRSSDPGKAQEKFSQETGNESSQVCRNCGKTVYKMEEMKAERNIWHRNCFRCKECSKQLSVDTYQSHEGVLYCKPHFRLLFSPKAVEDNEPVRPRKHELIIRENQPVELPPDVVRASDKPDLGLEELHQLNVKSRFEVFEHYGEQNTTQQQDVERTSGGVKRSASILSKLAKFQAKGMNTGVSDEALHGVPYEQSSDENDSDNQDEDEGEDADLVRAKRAQRERPIRFDNMDDIKNKFESGHLMTKEERREERKQEIQNIRSRLFMGKQAKIKEMYQQAVAESELGITAASKKPEIDIGDKAKSLKEKFETGELFKSDEASSTSPRVQEDEMAVFEQGLGKQSRSIFMELDATALKAPQSYTAQTSSNRNSNDSRNKTQPFSSENVIKYDEKADDVKIETSEISSKFKFFEQYQPEQKQRKAFRITPPRDGVVKEPSPEYEIYIDPNVVRSNDAPPNDDPTVAKESHTATKMLSLFRQMEDRNENQSHQQQQQQQQNGGLKPLKRFTPPPDDNRRVYTDVSDNELSETDEEDEEEECEEEGNEKEAQQNRYEDEFLKQARSAAHAKQLRAKFEKWESNLDNNSHSPGFVDIYGYPEETTDESQIESAKAIRAKFESMRETKQNPSRPRTAVNRFV